MLLLLATGGLLGCTFPLGKLAMLAGVPPAIWALTISAGAGGSLLLWRLAHGRLVGLGAARLRYYLIAAMAGLALPNLLVFATIPHLGAGFTALAFTLSPVLTLALALLLRLRPPDRLGILGIAVSFAGAITVALTRGEIDRPAEPLWLLAALLIPASLACGNIYRTRAWPVGAEPQELAIGTNLGAALLLAAYALATSGALDVAKLALTPHVTLAQIVSATLMFALFFRLQAVGGPVYLSLIGYVGAALGLLAGTLLLGERYALLTWIGALTIAIGVALTTLAQARQRT